ncbi:hypothetical protein AC578_4411 [Pseudocercospora eumusae]|uniref:Methyltransferase domain-containing protein n=1 Tax=Pseudocercospora eumusae TaxID=321146 RepID=A0A139GVV9_9PEZI|nr:hypothetical protein AC578_4411 [Pseudocercospora eumusae]
MKVCVVLPRSADDDGEAVQPDVANYIDREVHSVQTKLIRREHAIEDIDDLEIGNFDVFINYLPLNLEWIETLRYLNTKYLFGIGTVPDFALDLYAASKESAKASEISYQLGSMLPSCGRSFQDGDYAVLVVLFGQTPYALTPLSAGGDNEVKWTWAPQSELSEQLRATAVSTFRQIRASHEYLGYLGINLHVAKDSAAITVINVDLAPRLFYAQGVSPLDDLIARTIPGGHAAFFEILLSTRLARVPHYTLRNQGCARQHDRLARLYYTILDSTNVTYNRLSPFVGKYDYNGTVLDCCSGSGEFARFATENGVKAKFTALDYSVEMTKLPCSKKLYEQPFIIGPVQEVLSSAPIHDHVVCFGSLHLLQPFDFVSTISQMFLRAAKSVTFDVDDLSQTYIRNFPDASSEKCWEKLEYNHNHVATIFRFRTPVGWKAVVHGERRYAYHSLVMDEDVYTYSFRFEKVVGSVV